MPKTVLMRDWKTATIELITAVIAPKIEEMKLPMESAREGMIAVGVVCLSGSEQWSIACEGEYVVRRDPRFRT